ncbi:MAG: hypothetical protein AAF368_20500, partial [Planctomycetota bacterium]
RPEPERLLLLHFQLFSSYRNACEATVVRGGEDQRRDMKSRGRRRGHAMEVNEEGIHRRRRLDGLGRLRNEEGGN